MQRSTVFANLARPWEPAPVATTSQPSHAARASVSGSTTGTERAVLGLDSALDVLDLFSAYTLERIGRPVAAVCCRAGRIDVVWGVRLDDGRDVVIKAHRPPVDLVAVTAGTEAKQPCRRRPSALRN